LRQSAPTEPIASALFPPKGSGAAGFFRRRAAARQAFFAEGQGSGGLFSKKARRVNFNRNIKEAPRKNSGS